MALKIRLRQQGRTNRPFYRMVVTDIRAPRDGKYVECIGWYNPFEEEQSKKLLVKEERLAHWLEQGAQLSEKTEALCLQAAPSVVKQNIEKQAAKRLKMVAKKRAARKKAAAAK